MSDRWSNDAFSFDTETDASTEVVIPAVTEYGESLNTVINAPDTGAAYPEPPTVGSVAPVVSLATEALELVLDNLGLTGKKIDSGAGNPGFTSYSARHDSSTATGRAAGAVHASLVFGDGHAVIESITANAGQIAVARLQIHGLSSDGEATPIARAWNISLPTWPVEERYSLGAIRINGVYMETIKSVNINYNVQFEKPIDGALRYPKVFDILKVAPVTSLVFDDPQEINDVILSTGDVQITETGRRLTSADVTELQFRNHALNGSVGAPTAKAGLAHYKCGVNGFAHVLDPASASGPATQTTTVEIRGEENATGVPLIWTKDQAIT